MKGIVRSSYILQKSPEISIKVYAGDYTGLVRAEFEFESEEDADVFMAPEWCGREITETDLGRDGRLIDLTKEKFQELLAKLSG